jgi:hypothetical protein
VQDIRAREQYSRTIPPPLVRSLVASRRFRDTKSGISVPFSAGPGRVRFNIRDGERKANDWVGKAVIENKSGGIRCPR